MALIQSTAIPSGATDYELEQSLRFNGAGYLSKTPSSSSNRKTSTFSTWVKISPAAATGGQDVLFEAYEDNANRWSIFIGDNTTNYIGVFGETGDSTDVNLATNVAYRDYSAWYHIMFVLDTTQGTAANRAKLYVNGEQVTSFSTATYPSQNDDLILNKNVTHHIGAGSWSGSIGNYYLNGYMSETHFIDGQALTPADFGETGDYGEWKPKAYSGSYGTNGFYLPFKQDYTVEGFSTVTWKGNSVNNRYFGGVGFNPDLIWTKARSIGYSGSIYDSVRGYGSIHNLVPSTSEAENGGNHVYGGIASSSADGFTTFVGTDGGNPYANHNEDGKTYVAWNWDMGGSNASNTNGSITSTVRANTTYGQSIVSFTGTGSSATVGHGLSSKPDVVLTKRRDSTSHWLINDWSGDYANKLKLNDTEASSSSDNFVNDASATTFTLGTDTDVNANNGTYIAYCFHSVTGYSKFGSYEGTGSSGNKITTGFAPAFVMVKNADATSQWRIIDTTRDTTDPRELSLFPDSSEAEAPESGIGFTVQSDGFTWQGGHSTSNASGNTHIYMAFADKREYAYWLDQSGNNNDWTSNNLTESDISVDSPTNNFATLNPLDSRSTVLAEGNLQNTPSGSNHWGTVRSTFAMPSGNWYAEFYCKAGTGNGNNAVGIVTQTEQLTAISNSGTYLGYTSTSWSYSDNDNIYNNNSIINNTGITYVTGDIIGVAFTGTVLKFYKNNSLIATVSSIPVNDYCFTTNSWTTSMSMIANFGQDSSFAGNKTAQGNQDGNDIGDFYYTPPTGFLALCTKNLPDVAVTPSEHFNTVLWTGDDGTNRSITGIGFQPDFVWAKHRNHGTAHSHNLADAVRGGTKILYTNTTDGEETITNSIKGFNTDGFTIGNNAPVNSNGVNYVAWNWKANGSGSSNSDGDITSTVSANTDAGFSIVSYTGDGSSLATIGHGLSKAPELIHIKNRTDSDSWISFTTVIDGSLDYMYLNLTNAKADLAIATPTSSVFSVDSGNQINGSGDAHIAYCFHSVDGYSKVGSYTGNGNADGTFVYTGFRPMWIMTKATQRAEGWRIRDTKRDIDNPLNIHLEGDNSGAEQTSASVDIDILSNGFKLRSNDSGVNHNGEKWIFLAFAETPFKNSNAR